MSGEESYIGYLIAIIMLNNHKTQVTYSNKHLLLAQEFVDCLEQLCFIPQWLKWLWVGWGGSAPHFSFYLCGGGQAGEGRGPREHNQLHLQVFHSRVITQPKQIPWPNLLSRVGKDTSPIGVRSYKGIVWGPGRGELEPKFQSFKAGKSYNVSERKNL